MKMSHASRTSVVSTSSNSSMAVESRGRGRELVVVGVPLGQRLLEDRRVRRHARQRVLADAACEIAVAQDRAVDEVEPDGLAGVVEPLEAILRHVSRGTGNEAIQLNISRSNGERAHASRAGNQDRPLPGTGLRRALAHDLVTGERAGSPRRGWEPIARTTCRIPSRTSDGACKDATERLRMPVA